MVNVYDIKTYNPKPSDKFLFDTNVLMFLYNSLNPDLSNSTDKSDIYSEFLSKIVKVESSIYISSLNLAEFVNAIITREYNIKKNSHSGGYSKKLDFRNSPDYVYAIDQIKPMVKRILQTFNKINDSFEELAIDNLVNDLSIDFNDEYFNYLCNYNDFKIVTDDADYKKLNSPLEVITGNNNLLTFSSN